VGTSALRSLLGLGSCDLIRKVTLLVGLISYSLNIEPTWVYSRVTLIAMTVLLMSPSILDNFSDQNGEVTIIISGTNFPYFTEGK